MCRFDTVAVSHTLYRFGCDVLCLCHLHCNGFQVCIGKPGDHLSEVSARQPFHNEMRETMVHSLSNYFRQRHAPWSQKTREPESSGHRRLAVLCGYTHDDGWAIRKRDLEDVVVRARAEATHVDRRMADCRSCQIARDGAVWRFCGHSRVAIVRPLKVLQCGLERCRASAAVQSPDQPLYSRQS